MDWLGRAKAEVEGMPNRHGDPAKAVKLERALLNLEQGIIDCEEQVRELPVIAKALAKG